MNPSHFSSDYTSRTPADERFASLDAGMWRLAVGNAAQRAERFQAKNKQTNTRTMNTEQLEAEEINTIPRIVITTSGIILVPHPSVKMVIPEELLMSALDLIEILKGDQKQSI